MGPRASILRRADDVATVAADGRPCVLVVGNFDGVHEGHAAVLEEAVEVARDGGLVASVLTFDPHPGAVVGVGEPPRLTTLERRAELMADLGVERVWVKRFDATFAAWSPERFARELVATALRARVVVVGQNFRFGAKRAGDLALLRTLGNELGMQVRVHAIARDEHGPYSSTRARDAIAAGDLVEAARVLGRPHSLSGPVVRGDARGRTLGFPTANVAPVAEMLPPDGVYAVRVDRLGPTAAGSMSAESNPGQHGAAEPIGPAVTNVGMRPTVGGASRTVETHVLGFEGDLYGTSLRLHLVERLRGEQKFASLEALKAQIAQDVDAARAVLGT